MKCLKKICILSIVLILLFVFLQNTVLAYNWDIDGMASSAPTDSTNTVDTAKKIAGSITLITRMIATGVAIIMLVVLAIKYMSAAPGDKADIKKHAVVYVVGAVIMFAVSGILGIIQKFAGTI